MRAPRYDEIGIGYAATRREDPVLRRLLHEALGSSRTVINVGAGTGSYEPRDRVVLAVEPSAVMIAQRPAGSAPVVRGSGAALPVRDGAVDAAMAVLTVHHWDDQLDAGLDELRRVARGPVVVFTFEPDVSARMWLGRDYLPEVAALDGATAPTVEHVVGRLGGEVRVVAVPTPRDTPDWTFASFWAHPERVFDPAARAATSAFARLDAAVVGRVLDDLRRDLDDGTWDARHGHLRSLDELDVGMRLIVARP